MKKLLSLIMVMLLFIVIVNVDNVVAMEQDEDFVAEQYVESLKGVNENWQDITSMEKVNLFGENENR